MHPLISPAELAARLHSPHIVVLDATLPPVGVVPAVDVYANYLGKHIPGAIFFDIEALSDHSTTLPHMLPTADTFAAAMSALGVGSEMTIVVYEQGRVSSAPRAWWMLRTMGAENVYLLDGGLEAWIEAGLPVESGAVHRAKAVFRPTLRKDAVRSLAEVRQSLREGGQVLDARAAGRFQATAPEPRPGIPSGHIPGSLNLPFNELTDGCRMKAAAEMQKLFEDRGLDLQREITTTCGSGVTAAVLALGLEICGAKRVGLYDGSWAEYAQHPESAIETGR